MSAVPPSPALLHEAENFTLFIKNSISFPRFKVNRFVGKEGGGAGGLKQLQLFSTRCLPNSAACFLEAAASADLLEGGLLWRGDSLEFLRVPSTGSGASTFPAGTWLPPMPSTQAQPGGGGERHLYEEMPL